jgi:hypothetical protein
MSKINSVGINESLLAGRLALRKKLEDAYDNLETGVDYIGTPGFLVKEFNSFDR